MTEETKDPATDATPTSEGTSPAAENEKPQEQDQPAEVAEIVDLEEIDQFFPAAARTPSLKELIQSSDSPSRYMIILAITFSFLALGCISLLVVKYLEYRHRQTKAIVTLKDPNHLDQIFTHGLGGFRVAWKTLEMRGEITVQCTTAEACQTLKERKTEVRDHVLAILQESSGEAILNPDQKLLIRRRIIDQLNEMPLNGKVLEASFTDLVVEPIHR